MTEGYTVTLKNGLKPLCAICDVEVYTEELSPFWYWASMDGNTYFFHTECALSNMTDEYRKGFSEDVLGIE